MPTFEYNVCYSNVFCFLGQLNESLVKLMCCVMLLCVTRYDVVFISRFICQIFIWNHV